MAGLLSLSLEVVGEILDFLSDESLFLISQVSQDLRKEAMRYLLHHTRLGRPSDLKLLVGRLKWSPDLVSHIKQLEFCWMAGSMPSKEHLAVLAVHLPLARGLRRLIGTCGMETILVSTPQLDPSHWRFLRRLTLTNLAAADLFTFDLIQSLPRDGLETLSVSFRRVEPNGWRWLVGQRRSLRQVRVLGALLPEPIPGVFDEVLYLTISAQLASSAISRAFPHVIRLTGHRRENEEVQPGSAPELLSWPHLRTVRGHWPLDPTLPYTTPNIWLDGRRHERPDDVLDMAGVLKPCCLSFVGPLCDFFDLSWGASEVSRLYTAVNITVKWSADDMREGCWIDDAKSAMVSQAITVVT